MKKTKIRVLNREEIQKNGFSQVQKGELIIIDEPNYTSFPSRHNRLRASKEK